MICCKTDLGEFAHNEEVKTGINAAQSGAHKLIFSSVNFTKFELVLNFNAGEEIVIPAFVLMEDFVYTLKIKQPDKTFLSVTVDGDPCENFCLKIYVSINNICNDYICNY